MTESNRIEYKRELTDSLEKEVVSFLNAREGGVVYGLDLDDFFAGHSAPRNKEIMRVFRDLEIVEHLGSGIPRILEAYGKDSFQISRNFFRLVFPYPKQTPAKKSGAESGAESGVSKQATPQVTPQVKKLLATIRGEMDRDQLQATLALMDRKNFRGNYLTPALEAGLIEMTHPDSPKSPTQKYRLTEKGCQWLAQQAPLTPE